MKTIATILLLFLSGCLSVSDPGYEIELGHSALITVGLDSSVEKKSGETVRSDGSPILIEKEGRISLLIYPAVEGQGAYKVNLKEIKDWGGESLAAASSQAINDVLSEFNKIQVLMSENKAQEALGAVTELKKKYPKLSYLSFIEASCHFMLGNMDQARQNLNVALKDFPDNELGLTLEKKLKDGAKSGGGN